MRQELSYPQSAPAGVLTVPMKRKELWPREERLRVTGTATQWGTRSHGDERRIYKHTSTDTKGKPHGETGNVSLKDTLGHWSLWLSRSKAEQKQQRPGDRCRKGSACDLVPPSPSSPSLCLPRAHGLVEAHPDPALEAVCAALSFPSKRLVCSLPPRGWGQAGFGGNPRGPADRSPCSAAEGILAFFPRRSETFPAPRGKGQPPDGLHEDTSFRADRIRGRFLGPRGRQAAVFSGQSGPSPVPPPGALSAQESAHT